MKKYMKQMLLVAIFMLLGSLNVMRAEHNQPNTPCVKMHFAGKIGSKYALLIMGAEEGEYTLNWGRWQLSQGKTQQNCHTNTGKHRNTRPYYLWQHCSVRVFQQPTNNA